MPNTATRAAWSLLSLSLIHISNSLFYKFYHFLSKIVPHGVIMEFTEV